MRPLPKSYVPSRLFIDSNTQQAISDHGEAIFDFVEYEPCGRSGANQEDVEALRDIIVVASQAAWEFVVSENSFREAEASRNPYHLQYCSELGMHWSACLAASDGPFDGSALRRLRPLDDGRCGYLSEADARLVRDAVLYECDTFLTIERKLTRNAEHLSRVVGIEVMRPPELWAYLRACGA